MARRAAARRRRGGLRPPARPRRLHLVQPHRRRALHGGPRLPALPRAHVHPPRGGRLLGAGQPGRGRGARRGDRGGGPGARRRAQAGRRGRAAVPLPVPGPVRRALRVPAGRVPARGRLHGAAPAGKPHGRRRRHRPHGGRHRRGRLGGRPGPGLDVPVLQLRGQGRLLRLQGQGDPRHHRPGHPAVHARLDRALHGAELAGAPVDAQQPREPASRRDGVLHRARRRARGLHQDRRPRGHLALRPGLRLGPHPGLRLRAAGQDVPGARLPRARDPRARPVQEPARHGDRPPRRPDRAPRPGHVRP